MLAHGKRHGKRHGKLLALALAPGGSPPVSGALTSTQVPSTASKHGRVGPAGPPPSARCARTGHVAQSGVEAQALPGPGRVHPRRRLDRGSDRGTRRTGDRGTRRTGDRVLDLRLGRAGRAAEAAGTADSLSLREEAAEEAAEVAGTAQPGVEAQACPSSSVSGVTTCTSTCSMPSWPASSSLHPFSASWRRRAATNASAAACWRSFLFAPAAQPMVVKA